MNNFLIAYMIKHTIAAKIVLKIKDKTLKTIAGMHL